MKLKILLTVILTILTTISLKAQNNEDIFKKLSENNNITRVVVSKTLLRLSGTMDMGVNIKDLSKKLDKIEIYTSEDKSAITMMKQQMSKVDNDTNYDELMNVKDDGETTIIYAKTGNKGLFKEIILLNDDISDCSIIRMIGSFSLEDIQGITK